MVSFYRTICLTEAFVKGQTIEGFFARQSFGKTEAREKENSNFNKLLQHKFWYLCFLLFIINRHQYIIHRQTTEVFIFSVFSFFRFSHSEAAGFAAEFL
jgi:hypothetical protein